MTVAENKTAQSHIITVGGGKGGVGKSIVALNLAGALACEGHRVVIADMDLGAANQHLMLGVLNPTTGLQALLERPMTEANECLIPTQIPNLRLLAGSSGVFGAANITYAEKSSLLRKLRALDADIVIIDVGAGVSYNALDFFDLGARKLIVTTPQVTALHDAYAFLKSAVLRLLRHRVEDAIDVALLEPATLSTSTEKVVQILGRLRQIRPELAEKLFAAISSFGACMVGNQVMSDSHAGVFRAVAQTMRDYLGVEVPVLGWLRTSVNIHESINRRRPLALDPNSKDGAGFRKLAHAVLASLPAQRHDLGIVEDIAIDEPSAA